MDTSRPPDSSTAPGVTEEAESPPYQEHVGASRQYIRDIILGVNDGLVSMFLLVAGVAGGGLDARQILLAGVAGAIAGAVSMAAGEYMATKSQEEVFESERELESQHLVTHRDRELDELREMFGDMGITGDDLEHIVESFDARDDALLAVMMALEFGVVESERRSPITAMFVSGGLFLLGSLPSVVPFAVTSDPKFGLVVAAVAAGCALFAVGAFKTLVTKGSAVRAGAENLAVALAGAGVSYSVGILFDRFLIAS